MRGRQRRIPLHIDRSQFHLRLSLRQTTCRLVRHRLQRSWINLKQHLVFLDHAALFVVLPDQISRCLRLYLSVHVTVRRRHPLAGHHYVFTRRRHHWHRDRRRRYWRGRAFASGEQDQTEGKKISAVHFGSIICVNASFWLSPTKRWSDERVISRSIRLSCSSIPAQTQTLF